jgi:hypothetical protein
LGNYEDATDEAKLLLNLLFGKIVPLVSPAWKMLCMHKETVTMDDFTKTILVTDEAFIQLWLSVRADEISGTTAATTVACSTTSATTTKKRRTRPGQEELV